MEEHTPLEEVSWERMCELLDSPQRIKAVEELQRPTDTAAVMFVNQQLDSSNLGACSVMLVGPERTYQLEDVTPDRHLYDLPSQRQYAQYYVKLNQQNDDKHDD